MANRDCKLTHVIERLQDQPQEVRSLIVKMLTINPQDRPSAASLSEYIQGVKELSQSVQYKMGTISMDENLENYLVKLPALI